MEDPAFRRVIRKNFYFFFYIYLSLSPSVPNSRACKNYFTAKLKFFYNVNKPEWKL